MNKSAITTIIGIWMLLISMPVSHAQSKDQEILSEKQARAEVATDDYQYIIGPEDVLYIHVWKEEALSTTVSVRMDGKISLPLLDDVQAAGFTPLQLKEILTQKFKEFIDLPNVSVIVIESNSFKVFISGQIVNPGVYQLRNKTTLLQLISMAGGFTEWANKKNIIIIRKEKEKNQRFTINYNKIISGEDLNSNITLKPGDTIIVP